jgi:DNA modification methylase
MTRLHGDAPVTDWTDGPVRVLLGEALERLRELPDESVHCVVTSPPYWGLRSYLPDGHPSKHLELGLEAKPVEWVCRLAKVMHEVRRVLRSDGTLWLVLGDSYAHGGNGSRDPERWQKQSRNNDGDRIQRRVAEAAAPLLEVVAGPVSRGDQLPLLEAR